MEGSVAVECDGRMESKLKKEDEQRHGAPFNHLTGGDKVKSHKERPFLKKR